MHFFFTDIRIDSTFAEEDSVESSWEFRFLPFMKCIQNHEYDSHLTRQRKFAPVKKANCSDNNKYTAHDFQIIFY